MKKKWLLRRVREERRVEVASTRFICDEEEEGEGSELSSCPSHSVTPCNNQNKFEFNLPLLFGKQNSSHADCTSVSKYRFSGRAPKSLLKWWSWGCGSGSIPYCQLSFPCTEETVCGSKTYIASLQENNIVNPEPGKYILFNLSGDLGQSFLYRKAILKASKHVSFLN